MLDDRKEQILSAIVRDYVDTAEPVGSRTISKKYQIGFSSATIRNEMSDLEDLGYIMQLHTSSGRVPTDEGYRYFVDQLMIRQPYSYQAEQALYNDIKGQTSMDDDRIHAIIKTLADMSGYPVALLIPEAEVTKPLLSLMELIYLMPGRGLMIVITDDERVEQRLIDLPGGFTQKELSVVNSVLSHYLRGLSIAHWQPPLIEFLIDQMGTVSRFVHNVLDILNEILSGRQKQQVCLEGALNILGYEEFQDMDRIKKLLTAFNDDDCVASFFEDAPQEGVAVRIGDENPSPVLEECAMALTGFNVGKHVGQISIIGPKRMRYQSCVALLEAVSQGLKQVFTRMENNDVRKNALSTVVCHDGSEWSRRTDLVIFEKQ
jgi:heat-inducible transcriptional repressor